jgi:hypothetical protein
MILAVLVIAALLLLMPNMLLLALIAASASLSCEWPETYVAAPKPTKVAVPGMFSGITSERMDMCLPMTRQGVQSSNSGLEELDAGDVTSFDIAQVSGCRSVVSRKCFRLMFEQMA